MSRDSGSSRCCGRGTIAAEVVGTFAEEAFLIGLLQDCGILLLVQTFGSEYAALYESRNLSPTAFFAAERKRFPHHHVKAIAAMTAEWNLPECITRPLREHHQPRALDAHADPLERLCAVSYFVGSMRCAGEQAIAESEPLLREYAHAELNLSDAVLGACFRAAGDAYREVAHLFAESLPESVEVTDLLAEANRLLSHAATDNEQHIRRIEQERDRYSSERATLAHAVAQYRERAARDPLTGLLNRGALVEATVDCVRQAEELDLPLTVLFLDIDNFKALNDQFGHQAGDEVLKGIAAAVQDAVSNAGLAGRYGGEEFVVVMAGLSEHQARRRALSLMRAIRGTAFPGLELPGAVTCSLGALWGRMSNEGHPEPLFAASDELMYHAKRIGKDCCVFRSLESPDAVAILRPDTDAADPVVGAITSRLGSSSAPPVREDFQRVALKLNQQQPDQFSNARKQDRQGLLSPCVLSILCGPSLELRSEQAFVRNISTGGIGLLVARRLVRGDLVEIALHRESSTLYVAGLVAFCRHVEQTIHEVGVQIVNHARQPIFSHNPAAAIREADWLTQSVKERLGAVADGRRSA
ncbi:MAG: sensor domain-containing diguanylate cyclase [Planctomycetota bacterium]